MNIDIFKEYGLGMLGFMDREKARQLVRKNFFDNIPSFDLTEEQERILSHISQWCYQGKTYKEMVHLICTEPDVWVESQYIYYPIIRTDKGVGHQRYFLNIVDNNRVKYRSIPSEVGEYYNKVKIWIMTNLDNLLKE
jgi:hypothetical protein